MSDANTLVPMDLDTGLRELFGFDAFRGGQRAAVESIAAGRDVLVVMPTGSGKSLCYQLTACLRPGVTVVISPLIALMKDQVDSLKRLGLPACEINSSMSFEEQQQCIDEVRRGAYKLVYIAPERFRSPTFCEALRQVEVSMLAVDEAHCVSQWGHDFRPDYLRIAQVRRELGDPQTVALTATATRAVQQDIVAQLAMPSAEIQVSGFERPNLFFEVFHARRDADKMARLAALIEHCAGESMVVYCATRKQVGQVLRNLKKMGVRAAGYHGGMGDQERSDVQDAWMAGKIPLLVATNAFGMGVDKADVRAVVHYNIPGSVEAYYQEAGRAGRDGAPAHCLLLYNFADKGIHDFFCDNSYPLRTQVLRVWRYIVERASGPNASSEHGVFYGDAEQIARDLTREGVKVHAFGVESALRLLQTAGHLEAGGPGQGMALLDRAAPGDVRVDWAAVEHRREVAQKQLSDMLQYASAGGCLQVELLTYFNSQSSFGARCEHCSGCASTPAYAEGLIEASGHVIATDESPDVLVKKLLAGVARARGKRGAHAVAGMLRGADIKAVREAGFDRLSTFGILSGLRQDDLVHLLDLLTNHGLLERTEHGCVNLSEMGGEVMRGKQELPEALGRELGATLVEPSQAQARRQKQRASRSGRASYGGDTLQATLELLRAGKTIDQVAEARSIKSRTVTDHLLKLAARGDTFDLSAYLDADTLFRLRDLADTWQPDDPLRPLKDQMPAACSYEALKIHLAQILLERAEA